MKPGLGKGLGKLMDGDKVAAGQPSSEQGLSVKPLTGRGVTKLVHGTGSAMSNSASAEGFSDPVVSASDLPNTNAGKGYPFQKRQLIPPWFFYAADLLLLSLSVAVAMASPKPLGFGVILFCAVAIALGGFLSIIGLLKSQRDDG